MSFDRNELARALVESEAVAQRQPPCTVPFPFALAEPEDLAALYAVSDGLELRDGTRILPRGELAKATEWLVEDRALEWPSDLVVIGERGDMVLVRDLDTKGERAGGGLLEASHDALRSFQRVSRDLVGWLASRAGLGADPAPSPEAVLRKAAEREDADALATALAEAHYPGSERDVAHAALSFGILRARAGDEAGAMRALEQSVAARVRMVPRGAAEREALVAWRACHIAAKAAGLASLAEACAALAKG